MRSLIGKFIFDNDRIVLTLILFYRIKTLNTLVKHPIPLKLSVVIPARNEEINLPTLLSCLQKQTVKVHEIIVVNDHSDDKTEEIAKSFGCKVLNLDNSPSGWKGKNYACYVGAKNSTGDTLLFLDADLILKPNAIERLVDNYDINGVLSVQPYHHMEKSYEQLSLFFNTIAIAAVGICLPRNDKSIGLFGPVLMMDRALYFGFGGHALVKGEIVEDYCLGTKLRKMGISCNLFLGYDSISFQMYKGGLSDLIWGWSKNFASAAAGTPFFSLLSVILWLSAYYAVAIELIKKFILFFAGTTTPQILILYVAFYLVAGSMLYWKTKKIGKFTFLSCIFYIIPLAAFTLIFAFSLILKFVLRKVKWKGRWHKV